MKLLLVCAMVILSKDTFAQDSCKQYWKYFSLKETIEGKIIFFQQPYVGCGTISTASNAIILTNKGDTVRVLQLCDDNSTNLPYRLQAGDYVVAKPDGILSDFPGSICDPFACVFKDTYWGEIIKKK